MKSKLFFSWMLILITTLFSACQRKQTTWQVSSPNGKVEVIVTWNKADGSVSYVTDLHREDGKTTRALDKSTLGLVREDHDFSKGLKFTSIAREEIYESYSTISGKRINDVNQCNEITLSFEHDSGEIMNIIFRAYDEGMAFRYHFAAQDTAQHMVIDELSSFNLNTTGGKAWMQTYDTIRHWSLGYEIPYDREIPIGTSAPVSYG
ncbi:MAG: hypothetical protein EA394_00280, partial [Bacteroidia bacterium]